MCVRVAHIWLIPAKKDPTNIVFMNMLLVDAKGGRIHATVRKDLVARFRSMVEEGATYELHNAIVAINEGPYKITSHKHKLGMLHNSSFTKKDLPTIPINVFDFMSFNEILSSNVEETSADVIGHVIERGDVKETENEGRKSKVIDLTLQDLENNRLHCSLWGEHADKIVSFFVNHDNSSPVVLILQFCKTRKYLGAMGIVNAFYGTKLILNGDLPEVATYIARMKKTSLQLTQSVSQISINSSASLSDDLLNTKRMTIESMIESTQVCQGSVLATICEIETEVDWYFRSCTQCATLVTVDNGMLRCRKCKTCKSAVPRFKLHVIVMDDTGSTTFVLFDRQVTQFIGRNVQDLINEHEKGEGTNDYPPDFNVLIEKQVLFKVEVGEGNVVKKYRNYAVKKASDDVGVIEQFMSKYNLEKPNDGSVEELSVNGVAANNYNVQDVQEVEDSCSNTCVIGTPTSKTGLKRSSDSIDSVAVDHGEAGQASVTKPNRAVRVKIEPKDTRVV
ncbi:replication protein A 70 kDa DNA-binding subunit-like isoform X2 [Medicago truncatula]|nr:replication protein A 70 kDa DNA-binding subunit-like isoform X2 [Medicago truncatula]